MSSEQRSGWDRTEVDQRGEGEVAPDRSSASALPEGAEGPAGQRRRAPGVSPAHGLEGGIEPENGPEPLELDGSGSPAPLLEDLVSRAHGLMGGPRRGRTRRRVRSEDVSHARITLSPQQKVLVLDTWLRSKLSARDFASLMGMSEHTLYAWKKRFELNGPAGLADRPRGAPSGSRMSEVTKRAIVMLKTTHPDWGQDRIHDVLMRTEGYAASASAIARVLSEAGYVVEETPTKRHAPRDTRFERARPNQLWQTDLFTFILKRENRRVWVTAFMDDHSRFIVGFGVYASSSGALVREVFEAAVANFGAPLEVLTDNGPQYHTWRGKSAFRELLERRGIAQVVASPRHPQTLGKVERFWGTLWRELLEGAIFQGIDDARVRIGHFIDHYNFRRTHSGIEGLTPADRFFDAASTVKRSLHERVAANALELALHGAARKSFYLTGRIGDETIALHSQGGKVVMTKGDGTREEVDLTAEGRRAECGVESSLPAPVAVHGAPLDPAALGQDSAEFGPGESALDDALEVLARGLEAGGDASTASGAEGGAS